MKLLHVLDILQYELKAWHVNTTKGKVRGSRPKVTVIIIETFQTLTKGLTDQHTDCWSTHLVSALKVVAFTGVKPCARGKRCTDVDVILMTQGKKIF